MDQQKLLDIASYVTNLKMYPYFDAAHYVVMCLMVRDDAPILGRLGATGLSRKHPLASWVASMLMCFAGSILANLLVGESIVVPFKHEHEVILATLVWYAINYSPFDLVYKLCKFAPFHLAAHAADQLHVAAKVHQGVSYAMKHYTNAYLIAVVIGVVKGAGHWFMQPVQRLVCGAWIPLENSILIPSFDVKASIVASAVFIVQARGIYITAPFSVVNLGVVMFLVYFDVVSEMLGTHDPFAPFENVICMLFFGGAVDALRRALTRGGPATADGDTTASGDRAACDKKSN